MNYGILQWRDSNHRRSRLFRRFLLGVMDIIGGTSWLILIVTRTTLVTTSNTLAGTRHDECNMSLWCDILELFCMLRATKCERKLFGAELSNRVWVSVPGIKKRTSFLFQYYLSSPIKQAISGHLKKGPKK